MLGGVRFLGAWIQVCECSGGDPRGLGDKGFDSASNRAVFAGSVCETGFLVDHHKPDYGHCHGEYVTVTEAFDRNRFPALLAEDTTSLRHYEARNERAQ